MDGLVKHLSPAQMRIMKPVLPALNVSHVLNEAPYTWGFAGADLFDLLQMGGGIKYFRSPTPEQWDSRALICTIPYTWAVGFAGADLFNQAAHPLPLGARRRDRPKLDYDRFVQGRPPPPPRLVTGMPRL